MTATQPGPMSTPGSQAPLVPSSCRASVLVGDCVQIDVVFPAAVALSALVDHAREAINRDLRSRGDDVLPPGRYEFVRAENMTALSPDASLAAQGVVDGDLLALVPEGEGQRFTPNIENVSTALARWAKDRIPAVTARDAVMVAVTLTGISLAIAALIVWRMRWAHTSTPLPAAVFAGTAIVLLIAAVIGARVRAGQDPTEAGAAAPAVSSSAGVASVLAAVLAGATAPPGAHPGAAHGFLAALVACAGVLLLARFTGRHWAFASAVITFGATAIGVGVVRMFWPVPGQRIAIVVLIGVLVVSYSAPKIGQRLARVPRQSFGSITGRDLFARAPGQPEDTLSPVESAPHDITLRGDQVGEVALRSYRVLAGVLVGVALVELAASIAAINPGHGSQWPFIVVVATTALCLVLRARALRSRVHATTMVCGAALSLFAIPAHFGFAADPAATVTGLWAAAAVVGVALAAMLAGAVVPSHIFSEPIREAVEYLEYVGYALIVPFVAWALGLLHYVRYH